MNNNKVYYYSEDSDIRTIRSGRLKDKSFVDGLNRRFKRDAIFHVVVYPMRLSERLETLKDKGMLPFKSKMVYEYEIDLTNSHNTKALTGEISGHKCGIKVKDTPAVQLWNHKYWKHASSKKEYRLLSARRKKELSDHQVLKNISITDYLKNKHMQELSDINKTLALLQQIDSKLLPSAWLTMNDGLEYKSKLPMYISTGSSGNWD